ncbi:hypothetical protein F4780DRAFT_743992 [Xylariomycetidae sp. FL0641]|nr:hypothetical protein F4780DRAFT_743992 [Xylariomycetidae sp. FL0641]
MDQHSAILSDPLDTLPVELVLRILHFATISTVARLSRVSRAWYAFIQEHHQNIVYASLAPKRAGAAVDLRQPSQYFRSLNTFTKYGQDVTTWKEALRSYFALEDAWRMDKPSPTDTVIQVGRLPVWRFRPDFKRRFILSTCHAGGFNVTDMDTGALLWSLDKHEVRKFAHLEYQDGTAVWDRLQNALEVWKTDLPGLERGQFRRVAVLPHDVPTRGFQLSHNCLCVVSCRGKGFVYDVPLHPELPKLRKVVAIEDGAVGHLDQSKDAVIYSMGTHDYHVYDKTSGRLLGHIHPHLVKRSKMFHIAAPTRSMLDNEDLFEWRPSSTRYVRPKFHGTPGFMDIRVFHGPRHSPSSTSVTLVGSSLRDDEWGAGMVHGKTMVGVSRGGRLMVCGDWPRALKSEEDLAAVTSIVECEPNGDTFELGGWLHIHETPGGKRVIFEIKDFMYILALTDEGEVDTDVPAFAASTCSTPNFAIPISFMGVYDDCIMSTFTTLGIAPVDPAMLGDQPGENIPRWRHFPTKAIRTLKFAPKIDGKDEGAVIWRARPSTSGPSAV